MGRDNDAKPSANPSGRTTRAWMWTSLLTTVAVGLAVFNNVSSTSQVGAAIQLTATLVLVILLVTSFLLFVARSLIWLTVSAADRRRERLQLDFDARICTQCGYDLRTLPDRCPECGAPRERWWA